MSKIKTALVTGSTSGIGLGIANKLASAGYNIILNGLGNNEDIQSTIKEIERHGVKTFFSGANLLQEQEIIEMIKDAKNEIGDIDILINNAGIQHVEAIETFPSTKWQQIIALNLSACFYTTKHVITDMKKRNWGRIINIASAHGKVASVDKSAYVAAKHGVIGLTKTTALETAEYDITCNAICPGWVLTPLVQKQLDIIATQRNINQELAKQALLSEKQPSLQFVKAEEIGSLVLYLCQKEAAQITGSDISVDGGWTAK